MLLLRRVGIIIAGNWKRRRDHLKNEWVWHGPLFLAIVLLIAVLSGYGSIAFRPWGKVLPLIRRCWGVDASAFGAVDAGDELQREIDEVGGLSDRSISEALKPPRGLSPPH